MLPPPPPPSLSTPPLYRLQPSFLTLLHSCPHAMTVSQEPRGEMDKEGTFSIRGSNELLQGPIQGGITSPKVLWVLPSADSQTDFHLLLSSAGEPPVCRRIRSPKPCPSLHAARPAHAATARRHLLQPGQETRRRVGGEIHSPSQNGTGGSVSPRKTNPLSPLTRRPVPVCGSASQSVVHPVLGYMICLFHRVGIAWMVQRQWQGKPLMPKQESRPCHQTVLHQCAIVGETASCT